MMLLQANKVRQLLLEYGGNLEAPAGKSLLVKAVYCIPSAADDYLTLSVDRVTVGFYRVAGRAGNHLSPMLTAYAVTNMMAWLLSKGINVAIPVAEGQV
ncbi:unnamed protein product, partial [marine sediment metagenome]